MLRRDFLFATLMVRSRTDSGPSQSVEDFSPRASAIILCDMWDRHWCRGANERVAKLVEKTGPLLIRARSKGVTIIHAPSETMDFYKDYPQRKAVLDLPPVTPPKQREITAPPIPIDDSDGGCDTPGDTQHKAWSRQHPGIEIKAADYVTDKGDEVLRVLKHRGIKTLFVMGVHTNMCILNRTFAIKQMTKWGVHCVLIRDLTDAMYDPNDKPHVSHERGTELVVEYIERYWCPTTTSADLMRVLSA